MSGGAWTESDIKNLLWCFEQDFAPEETAIVLKRTYKSVVSKASKLGLLWCQERASQIKNIGIPKPSKPKKLPAEIPTVAPKEALAHANGRKVKYIDVAEVEIMAPAYAGVWA